MSLTRDTEVGSKNRKIKVVSLYNMFGAVCVSTVRIKSSSKKTGRAELAFRFDTAKTYLLVTNSFVCKLTHTVFVYCITSGKYIS